MPRKRLVKRIATLGSGSATWGLTPPGGVRPHLPDLREGGGQRTAAAAGAPRVWAPTRSAGPLRNREIPVTDAFREGDDLPGGIRALQTPRAAEVVYWLPDHNAVVVGDVLLGAGAKPNATTERLRLCPERWLGVATHDDLREALRPLLELPVESVLVSHGEPVLAGGGQALAAVLG